MSRTYETFLSFEDGSSQGLIDMRIRDFLEKTITKIPEIECELGIKTISLVVTTRID